jgi:hypothetical protein
MLLMLALYWIGTAIIVPWVTETLDHWDTGSARLAHYRLDVGHHGTGDFFTAYLHGEAVVIEFPGGDATQARTYIIPVTDGNDPTPRIITLEVKSLNPNGKPGKPDLVVEVEGIASAFPLYNTGTAFQVQSCSLRHLLSNEEAMHTVRIYRLTHLSSTRFQALKAAQMEAAQVWNRCCELHHAARKAHTRWPGRDEL